MFKSPIISPESRFEAGFYRRRLIPYESTYIRRFENRGLSRFRGIRKKNRPKRFQIENDSQKGGTIPGRSRHRPLLGFLASDTPERALSRLHAEKSDPRNIPHTRSTKA